MGTRKLGSVLGKQKADLPSEEPHMPKKPKWEEIELYSSNATIPLSQSQLLGSIAAETGVEPAQIAAAISLLENDNTIPFVARYRKEATCSLDEEQLRTIWSRFKSLSALQEKKIKAADAIRKLGKLRPDLASALAHAKTPQEVDDLYLPYKTKRSTRGSAARDAGLTALASLLLHPTHPKLAPVDAAAPFARPGTPFACARDALQGACDILAERAAENPGIREAARELLRARGTLASKRCGASASTKSASKPSSLKAAKTGSGATGGEAGGATDGMRKGKHGFSSVKEEGAGSDETSGGAKLAAMGVAGASGQGGADTYALYAAFASSIARLAPHQVLALNRGEGEGVLKISLDWDVGQLAPLATRLLRETWGEVVGGAVTDAAASADRGTNHNLTLLHANPRSVSLPGGDENIPVIDGKAAFPGTHGIASSYSTAHVPCIYTTPLNKHVGRIPATTPGGIPVIDGKAAVPAPGGGVLLPLPLRAHIAPAPSSFPPATLPAQRAALSAQQAALSAMRPRSLAAPQGSAPLPSSNPTHPPVYSHRTSCIPPPLSSCSHDFNGSYGLYEQLVAGAVKDGLHRLLGPRVERDIRHELTAAAEERAIKTFAANVRSLLLQPPLLPAATVLGVDPAYRTGCKLAVVGPTGAVLHADTVYATPPAGKEQVDAAREAVRRIVGEYGVGHVAIGNGVASREAELFIADALRSLPPLASVTGRPLPSSRGPLPSIGMGRAEVAAAGRSLPASATGLPLASPPALPSTRKTSSPTGRLDLAVTEPSAEVCGMALLGGGDVNDGADRKGQREGARMYCGEGAGARHPARVTWSIVSEAGASVYSASPLARAELPHLDVSLRGAVCIARRRQDPMSELVKVDPMHLGVGLYQHDMSSKALREALDDAVESAVSEVGVSVNTASAALLRRVAGLNAALAEAIVRHRDGISGHRDGVGEEEAGEGERGVEKKGARKRRVGGQGEGKGDVMGERKGCWVDADAPLGGIMGSTGSTHCAGSTYDGSSSGRSVGGSGNHGFRSIEQLLEVKGIGKKRFEQCAGFLRVTGGDDPLDATPIHPESYGVARKLLARALSVGGSMGSGDTGLTCGAGAGAGVDDDEANIPGIAHDTEVMGVSRLKGTAVGTTDMGAQKGKAGKAGKAGKVAKGKETKGKAAGVGLVSRILSLEDLKAAAPKVASLRPQLSSLAAEFGVGEQTLADVIEALAAPGRDVRESSAPAALRSDVMNMGDLRVGMELAGTVRNVVTFGAFVDVGVGQDGLVHVSEMGGVGGKIMSGWAGAGKERGAMVGGEVGGSP
eukprot:jgi/Mesvir1/29152/Mv18443-RA.1